MSCISEIQHATQKLKKKYNIFVSEGFITNWFQTIGPCKGSLRLTSTFPPNKDSPRVFDLVQEYLNFIGALKDHKRLVFIDEKPFKGMDIFTSARRDPFTGVVPHLSAPDANSRKRHNCITALTLKKH